jgi:hypothetical protein
MRDLGASTAENVKFFVFNLKAQFPAFIILRHENSITTGVTSQNTVLNVRKIRFTGLTFEKPNKNNKIEISVFRLTVQQCRK